MRRYGGGMLYAALPLHMQRASGQWGTKFFLLFWNLRQETKHLMNLLKASMVLETPKNDFTSLAHSLTQVSCCSKILHNYKKRGL